MKVIEKKTEKETKKETEREIKKEKETELKKGPEQAMQNEILAYLLEKGDQTKYETNISYNPSKINEYYKKPLNLFAKSYTYCNLDISFNSETIHDIRKKFNENFKKLKIKINNSLKNIFNYMIFTFCDTINLIYRKYIDFYN